jgi:hypothetical protein
VISKSIPSKDGILKPSDGTLREERSATLLLIAVTLAGYGIYRALFIPGMLVGPPVPLLLVGFLLQAVFGIVAGVGVWRRARWAAATVVLLGASIAATALVEGFILWIVAYLGALLKAVAAVVLSLLIAAYVNGQLGPSRNRG